MQIRFFVLREQDGAQGAKSHHVCLSSQSVLVSPSQSYSVQVWAKLPPKQDQIDQKIRLQVKDTLFQVTLAVDNVLCKNNGKENMR